MASVSLPELLRRVSESREQELHVALPARVEKYHANIQRADVFIPIQRQVRDADGYRHSTETIPRIYAVPVLWPRAGGYYIHFPLQRDDHVLMVFCDWDPSGWLSNFKGLDTVEEERRFWPPLDLSTHDLSFGFAIPGIASDEHPLPDAPTGEGLIVAPSGGTIRVSRPGADADFVALADKVTAQLNELKLAISGAAVSANDGGASFKAAIVGALADWPGDVGSTVLKAET